MKSLYPISSNTTGLLSNRATIQSSCLGTLSFLKLRKTSTIYPDHSENFQNIQKTSKTFKKLPKHSKQLTPHTSSACRARQARRTPVFQGFFLAAFLAGMSIFCFFVGPCIFSTQSPNALHVWASILPGACATLPSNSKPGFPETNCHFFQA